MNYIVQYTPLDAIRTGLTCLFSGTTKFTFVVWMLPELFRSNMFTIITAIAVEGMKKRCQYLILPIAFWLQYKYAGVYLPCSAIAVLLALLQMDIADSRREISRTVKYGVVAIGTIFAVWVGTWWPATDGGRFHWFTRISTDHILWFNLAALALITTVIFSQKLRKIFSHKWFVWFGDLSFGFYLFHDVVQGSFGSIAYHYIYYATYNKILALARVFIAYIVLSTAIAFLFHKTVDKWTVSILNVVKERIYDKRS